MKRRIALIVASSALLATLSACSFRLPVSGGDVSSPLSSDGSAYSKPISGGSAASEGSTTTTIIDSQYRGRFDSSYATNSGYFDVDNLKLDYCGARWADVVNDDDLTILAPSITTYGDVGAYVDDGRGYIGLFSPCDSIASLSITYKAYSPCKVTFYQESHNDETSFTVELPTQYSYSEFTYSIDSKDYFYFNVFGAVNNDMAIREIKITTRDGINCGTTPTYQRSGEGRFRLAVDYETEGLIAGESIANMPTKVEYDEKNLTYNVVEEKWYTYYDTDYVNSHPEDRDSIALTDPVDVLNYINAFGSFPLNYGGSQIDGVFSKSTAQMYFGDKYRQISKYNRQTGYVNAIEQSVPGDNYYELDVNLDGSYGSSRGIGRLVVFGGGFYGENRFSSVFTDDHYITFQEYYNDGSFSPRFNAQGPRGSSRDYIESKASGFVFGKAVTITKKA